MEETPDRNGKVNGMKLDEEFVKLMLDVEANYSKFNKHEKIKIEQWTRKLCQVTSNVVWKQNRNLYALLLVKNLQKGELSDPFSHQPSEHLPTLNRQIVMKRLASLDDERAIGKKLSQHSTPSKEKKGVNPSAKTRPVQEISYDQRSETSYHARGSTAKAPLWHILDKSAQIGSKRATPSRRVYFDEENENPNYLRESHDQSRIHANLDQKQREYSILTNSIKSEANGFQRMKTELDLARLTEESLKNELNMKKLENDQFKKKFDSLVQELQSTKEENTSLKAFYKVIRKRTEEGSISFADMSAADLTIREINRLSITLNCSPITAPPKIVQRAKPVSVFDTRETNSFMNLTNKSENVLNLASERSNTRRSDGFKEKPSLQKENDYNLNFANLSDIQIKNSPSPKHNTNNHIGKILNTTIDSKDAGDEQITQDLDSLRDYLNKNIGQKSEKKTTKALVQIPQNLPTSQPAKVSNQTEYNDLKKKIVFQDKETTNLLNYLEKFQKENSKLKSETQLLLERSNKLNGLGKEDSTKAKVSVKKFII